MPKKKVAAVSEEEITQEQETVQAPDEVKEETSVADEETTLEQEAEVLQTNEQPEEEPVNKEEEAVVISAGTTKLNHGVLKLLRIFNTYDELYITADGGVFPRDNKPAHVKGAVLYKNPFFKK